jgi:hypothetical protein
MARRVKLPESKIRRKRRVKRTRLFLLVAILTVILIGGLVGATWIPQIRIHTVVVEGMKTIPENALAELVKEKISERIFLILPADNIFFYPKKNISRELLLTYPSLRTAQLRASDFQSVTVSIEERAPHALWCGTTPQIESPCALMDESGFIYAPAADFSGDAYFTYYGGATSTDGYLSALPPKQFLTREKYTQLSTLIDAFAKKIPEAKITRVVVDAHDDVRLSFDNGFSIIFALKDAGGDVFERFGLALSAEPFTNRSLSSFEYIDMRFGDKLYYHLKNK